MMSMNIVKMFVVKMNTVDNVIIIVGLFFFLPLVKPSYSYLAYIKLDHFKKYTTITLLLVDVPSVLHVPHLQSL